MKTTNYIKQIISEIALNGKISIKASTKKWLVAYEIPGVENISPAMFDWHSFRVRDEKAFAELVESCKSGKGLESIGYDVDYVLNRR